MPKTKVAYVMRFEMRNVASGEKDLAGVRVLETRNGAHQR